MPKSMSLNKGLLKGILPNLNSNLNQSLNLNLDQHDKPAAKMSGISPLKLKLFKMGMKQKLGLMGNKGARSR